MIPRRLEKKLKHLLRLFPIVSVTGPRQSGKTTLVQHAFPKLPYVSLEDPDNNLFATNDPRGFLDNFNKGAIIDEAQRVPELFSYLQGFVDNDQNVKFVLSGSQNFLLSERISQSLAGRVGILNLLPFSMYELRTAKLLGASFETVAFKGFYPRMFDRNISPNDFYPNYVQTYVERDVRQIINVTDLHTFSVFLKLCAGRAGQLLNLSEISNDSGMTVNTIKSWINLLETSYIVFRLYPHHRNFNKRLIKMPKLYFYDTGLLCYLLNIKNATQLKSHYAKGAIFENLIITELQKRRFHTQYDQDMYFWRDHKGREIDLILDQGETLVPIEIKSGVTKKGNYFDGLDYWNHLSGNNSKKSYVIYGGKEDQVRSSGKLLGWQSAIDYDF